MVRVSKINIYSNKWELEGQFNTIDEVVEEWLVDEESVEEALDQLTIINNRYLVYEEELGKKIHLISRVIEDELLDVLGESLDKEDERLIYYQVELKQEVERANQYKHDFETVNRKYMTVVHEQEQLLRRAKELEEQLQVATTNHQNSLQLNEALTGTNRKLERELGIAEQLLTQVEAILRGEPVHSKGVDTAQTLTNDLDDTGLTKGGTITDGVNLNEDVVESEELDEEEELERSVEGSHNTRGGKVKKKVKARVKWEEVLKNPSFPLLSDLKQKKFWHLSELSSKLSKPPRSIVTESDLDFIIHKIFTKLGYKKDMPNPKLLNAQEATWIILASYYNSDASVVGLERLSKSVEMLYDDWYKNREVIVKTLKQG